MKPLATHLENKNVLLALLLFFALGTCSLNDAKAEDSGKSIVSIGKAISQSTYELADDALNSVVRLSQNVVLSFEKYLESVPPSEEEIQSITHEQLLKLSSAAKSLIVTRDNENSASTFTLLSKSKKDYQTDAEQVLQDILEVVLDGDLSFDYFAVRTADVAIKEKENEIATLTEEKYFAPVKSSILEKSKQDITDKISILKKEIKDLNLFIVQRQHELKLSLWKIGVRLDDSQIRALTTRADSDELFQIFIVFDVAKAISMTLEKLLSEDDIQKSNLQVKYYGSYVILAELVVYAQELYMEKVNQKYLPDLQRIKLDTIENINFAEQKIKKSSSNNAIFKSNIDANNLALQVIDLYEELLLEQINNTKKARQKALEQVHAAYSSYDTAANTQNILKLINEDQLAFEKMISLQAPVIVLLDTTELSQKFAEISVKLR